MADLATAYVQVVPTTKGIGSALASSMGGEAEVAGKTAGKKLATGFLSAGKAVGTSIVAGTAAIAAFGKSAVSAGMDFDASMSQVAATMGKSVDEIGELRDFAQEMGSKTSFSATQAADALNYMALASYDAETSMQMLPTVLDLAAAGGIDLASASDMVTDAQSALGLSLEETSDMVDQMAKASSKSNTSVEQLGDAFLTIGATARNVKGGTQELATVLGVLADNGIKGSEGGTHLRNILLSLQDAAVDGAVDFGDFAVSIYDSEGNMRSMIDIIGDMQSGMEGMDQASKDAMISGVFNKTDLASVNALIGTSSERFDELSTAIENSDGAAKQMADTQLDNLAGDVTLFKSALEGVQIAVSDKLTPSLREFVQIGTEGLSGLAESIREGDIEGAMDSLSGMMEDMVGKLLDKLPDMTRLGISLIEGLLNAIVAALPNLVSSLPQIFEDVLSAIIEVLSTLGDHSEELVPSVVEMVLGIAEALINNVDKLLDAAVKIVVGLAKGLVQAIPKLVEKIPQLISGLLKGLTSAIPQLISAGVELFVSLVKNLPAIISGIVKAIPEIISAILDSLSDLCPLLSGIFEGAWEAITALWEVAVDFFSGIWEGISGVFSGVIEFFSSAFQGAWDAIKKVWDAVTGFFEDIWEGVKIVFGAVIDFFGGLFGDAWAAVETAWNGVSEFFGGIFDSITGAFDDIVQFFADTFQEIWETVSKVFDDIISAAQKAGDAIQKALSKDLDITARIQATGVGAGAVAGVTIAAKKRAVGGVVEKGELAFLEGTGAEAVVPLDQNEKWIHALSLDFMQEMARMGSVAGLQPATAYGSYGQASGAGEQMGTIIIPVQIGSRQIERIVIDAEKMRDVRTGGR